MACAIAPCSCSVLPVACASPKSHRSRPRNPKEEGRGWIETLDKGLLVMMQARPVCARSGSAAAPLTPPGRSSLAKLDQARKARQGPPLSPHHRKRQRRRTRPAERRGDRRLGNSAAPAHLSEGERAAKKSPAILCRPTLPLGRVDERYVQNQLDHAARK